MTKEKELQSEVNECLLEPAYAGTYKMEDTANMMKSPDYKIRFVAEYVQLKIRYEKLKFLLIRWEAFNEKSPNFSKPLISEDACINDPDFIGWLGFKPSCSFGLLKEQEQQMKDLLHTLEVRAEIEGINLTKVTIKL